MKNGNKTNNYSNSQRAILFVRSTSDNLEALSDQVRLCTEYCDERNVETLAVTTFIGSFMAENYREALVQLVSFCADKENGVTEVVVSSPDRLARNLGFYRSLEEILNEHGVALHSVAEGFVSEAKDGRSADPMTFEEVLAEYGNRWGKTVLINTEGLPR